MIRFEGYLSCEDINDYGDARLVRPLVFESDELGRHKIPAGFETDFFSSPWGLWNIIPPRGRYDRAAVVHDYFYRLQPDGVTRKQADVAIMEALEACGCSLVRRRLVYRGLRIGGWRAWNKNKRDLADICPL